MDEITEYVEESEEEPLLPAMDSTKIGLSTTALVVNPTEGRKLMQYLAALCATLGGFSLGTSLGWTSPLDSPELKTYDFEIDQESKSWIGALLPLGAAAFAFPIGFLIDRFGRKLSMLLLVLPFTLGWALIIWANGVEMIMAGRFILGIAGGSFAVAAPTYTSEIAEKSVRGALGSYFQLMITLGILLVYILGVGVDLFYISIICGIFPLIFGVLFSFMPDTPSWYITKGRKEDALRSLKLFRGDGYEGLEAELAQITEDVEKARREKVSMVEAFQAKAAKTALIIALGLMLIQQFSGVNAVIFYASSIFESAGSDLKSSVSTIIVGVVQFVMCFVSTLVVDRLGRKILLLASAAVMCICTILLGVYFVLQDDGNPVYKDIGWLPLVSLCLFMTMFSLGFGPIPWMIVGELFLPQTKGTAASIASCFNWILAFLVTKFYSNLKDAINTGPTFFIFSAVLLCGTVFVAVFVKETKGKSFEQIQRELGGN